MKHYFVLVLYILHCSEESVVALKYETAGANNYEDDTKSIPYSPGSNAPPETQLITVQMIWRHGERTQTATFPTDRFSPLVYNGYGVKGLGQLTERGAVQSYELGKYLRKRYNNGFIGPKYATDEIYLLSSDLDRCIMSGIAVCQALYPKFLQDYESNYNYGWGQDNSYDSVWFPVPIRSVPAAEDNCPSSTVVMPSPHGSIYSVPIRKLNILVFDHNMLTVYYKSSTNEKNSNKVVILLGIVLLRFPIGIVVVNFCDRKL